MCPSKRVNISIVMAFLALMAIRQQPDGGGRNEAPFLRDQHRQTSGCVRHRDLLLAQRA
jgi:hypothetical protein